MRSRVITRDVGTVLLMAVVVAVDPAQVGAVAYILSRPSAMRLLVAYFIGGFGVSLIAGGVQVPQAYEGASSWSGAVTPTGAGASRVSC